jgi:adenosyl cobinamide kinase/adenosyl cobinamide phosphate guanylyltransferase
LTPFPRRAHEAAFQADLAQRKKDLHAYLRDWLAKSMMHRRANYEQKWDRWRRNSNSIYDPARKARKESWQSTFFTPLTLQADPHGVRVPEDLDVIDTTAAPRLTGRRVLLTGGARSGKSAHAEGLAVAWGRPVTYVATGGARPDDAEWAARVAAHRSRRPRDWTTVETTDLVSSLRAGAGGSTLLVDCLTLWLTAQLDDLDAWRRDEAGEAASVQADVLRRTADLVDALRTSPADVILVTNEVGWGVVPATAAGRLFRDLMGWVNAEVARACDETILVVAGRRVPLEALARPSVHDDAGEG